MTDPRTQSEARRESARMAAAKRARHRTLIRRLHSVMQLHLEFDTASSGELLFQRAGELAVWLILNAAVDDIECPPSCVHHSLVRAWQGGDRTPFV